MIDFKFLITFLLDRWYKPIVLLGLIGVILTLLLSKDLFVSLFVAILFFGLGEWATTQETEAPLNAYWNRRGNLIQINRILTVTGLVYYLLALIFFILFIVKYFGD